MPSIQVPASERFDETALDDVVEDGNAGPLYTRYTCPSCNGQVAFSRVDFESRGLRETSNLTPEHSAALTALAHLANFASNEYLDWYCPGCKMATRVYFQRWAGGRHGDSGVELLVVVELPRDNASTL